MLHLRNNMIPQSHEAIQKLLSHLKISPGSQNAYLSISMIDLLVYYHIRTSNYPLALQMMKRKKFYYGSSMLNSGYGPVFEVTKWL